MPATQAPNETRLPRAVLRIGEDVQRRIAERAAQRESEPSLPAETPPASPPASSPEPSVTDLRAGLPVKGDPRYDDPRYWESRFRVVEGRIRSQSDELIAVRTRAQTREAELQSQITVLQASIPAAPTDLSRYFTPEQIASFGEDQCRTMATAAETAARTEAQTLIDRRVKPLEDERKDSQARDVQAAKDRLYGKLDELYPRWREVDLTQPWKDWLAQSDDATGLQRQDVLNRHIAMANAPRIAAMFKLFEDATRPPPPPVTPHGSAATAAEGAPPPPQPAQGAPTIAEINDFYKRAALGKVKDEERVQFETRIAAARRR